MCDEPFYRELQTHLSVRQREGAIQWLETLAGSEVEQTMHAHLKLADLILLLISPDFEASDSCCGTETQRAIEQCRAGKAHVIPVLLRPVDWQCNPFGKLKSLPSNGRPITSWPNRDEAFTDIVQGIRAALGYGPRRPVPFMVEGLPANFVQRPQEFESLIRCLLDEQREDPIAITATLRGAGGYGKTTLACALCHDERVWKAFSDGILWVTFGENPGNLVNKIAELLYTLNREKPGYTSLEAATTRLVELLADRDILLILDDVWNSAHLKPFLQGGKRCARLITTRDEQVVLSSVPSAQRIQVDAMQLDEAIQLLISGIQGFEEPAHLVHSYAELKRLATRLGEWPLLLTLARGMLQERINLYKQDVAHAIMAVHHALDKRGVTAFDHSNAALRSQAVAKTIEVSLEWLQPAEKARYQELAIFPEDVAIPLQTLQRLWGNTGNLDEFDTEDLCVRLRSLSLLLNYNPVAQTVRLHDVMRAYLQHQWTRAELIQLHARFLAVSKLILGLSRWADLPADEHYLWHHLVLHLCTASRIEELQATLTDLLYLAHKTLYVGISALEADLLRACTFELEQAVVTEPIQSLYQTVVRISHLLRHVSTLAEVGGLLLSYLGSQPSLAARRSVFCHELPRPFLTAWHPLPIGLSSALRRTLRGHTHWINGCAVSPDSSYIVSASWDRTLKVWDVATGDERLTLTGHTSEVRSCAVSPDSRFIVSASNDHTLKVWDARTGAERLTLTGHTDEVRGCAVSPDGSFIVSASKDHTLKVWNAQTGTECLALIGHTRGIRDCAVSPDSNSIVSASDDHTLKVWDAQTGVERLTLTGHTSTVRSCAVSPDGHSIVSASDDHTLKVWDALTGTERFTLMGHTDEINSCAASSNGSFIVSASDDHTLKVWDAQTGVERLTLTGHTSTVRSCAVSPDGHFIVSASNDHTLKVWDTATGTERLTLIGHTSMVRACAVSPDGSSIVSASRDRTLKIWDAATGVERLTLMGHTGGVFGCAVSPDGNSIVSASWDKTLKIWDTATGAERLTLTGHTNWAFGCAVSPDGSSIVSASNDHTLKVWDAATGVERLTLTGHTDSVSSCAVSPDGSCIISASWDGTLKVWDAATGAERLTLTGHRSAVRSCTVSPDGNSIVSASNDHTLKVWNAQTGQCMLTFPVDGALSGCAFHPDGEHLVACGNQGMYFLRLVA
jgi:WD40 repeat protein